MVVKKDTITGELIGVEYLYNQTMETPPSLEEHGEPLVEQPDEDEGFDEDDDLPLHPLSEQVSNELETPSETLLHVPQVEVNAATTSAPAEAGGSGDGPTQHSPSEVKAKTMHPREH